MINKEVNTLLCKFRGMLVLMEVVKGKNGKCPDCGDNSFTKRNGWIECDCGFALNESSYNKLIEKNILF